ncbi:MAG: branched-chain amino acid ABC transporter permease [Planctomycetia bacterium]|nr:branched-chain amino acid ABC transporter permease [Planctomycetia bacterium]
MLTLASEFQFSFLWLGEVAVGVVLYATLAASLNMVTGFGGMFSLGHHGFFAVGAYAAGWCATVMPAVEAGTPGALGVFLLSAAVAVLFAAAAGLLVGVPCLRLRGDYLAIATLAFGEIVRIVIQNTPALGGSLELNVPRLLMRPRGLEEVGDFRALFLGVGVVMLGLTLVVLRNVVRSAHGRAVVAVREDEIASELLGVPVTRYTVRAFVLGAAFAGLAGWFYAHYSGSIAPANFDMLVGIKILLIVVLGGLGSLTGTVLSAVVLVGIERLLLAGVFGEDAKRWMQVEYALVLILVMLLRPNGILGNRELSDFFRRRPAKGGVR